MALFPCSLCGTRFQGTAQHAYPAVVNSHQRWSAHVRLCNDCFDHVQELAGRYGIVYDGDPRGLLQVGITCSLCEKDIGGEAWALFVTAYPRGAERWDASSSLHPVCGVQLIDTWGLAEKA